MILTRAVPEPGQALGQRTYRLLETVRAAGFATHLVSLLGPGQSRETASSLQGLCRWAHLYPAPTLGLLRGARAWFDGEPATVWRTHQPEMEEKVKQLLRQVKLVVCVDAVHHPLLMSATGGLAPEPFYLLDLAEPWSHRLVTQATARWGLVSWALRGEAKLLRKVEASAARMAELTLVSNEIDLQLVAERAPGARLWSVGNGAPVSDSTPQADLADLPPELAFCGDLSIPAHVRSVVWLARTVLPMLREKVRGARLVVPGRQMPPAVRKLAELKWVELVDVAHAPAEAMRLSKCVAGVAPQRQARGAAERALMMMSLGRPIVCTPAVARMLPVETAVAPLLAENARQFAHTIERLLADRAFATRNGRQGRDLVKEHATWDAQWRRVGALLSELAMNHPVKVTPDDARPRDLSALRRAHLLARG